MSLRAAALPAQRCCSRAGREKLYFYETKIQSYDSQNFLKVLRLNFIRGIKAFIPAIFS